MPCYLVPHVLGNMYGVVAKGERPEQLVIRKRNIQREQTPEAGRIDYGLVTFQIVGEALGLGKLIE